MSDAWNEDEWVAAFLDGRLSERERAEMLARLTADDEAYEHFAATAAILREAEASEEPEDAAAGTTAADDDGVVVLSGSPPSFTPMPVVVVSAEDEAPEPGVIRLHARKPAARLRWLAIAAGIVGLAVAGRGLWLRTSWSGEPVRLAAQLAPGDLPIVWKSAWSGQRGDGDRAQEKAVLAARAGSQLVDLSMVVWRKDSARTRVIAGQIDERYDRRPDRTGLWKKIEDGAGGEPDRLRPLVEQATDRIAEQLGREPLELGAWTEAARLAAAHRNARFIRDRRTRPMLDRLAAFAGTDRPTLAAVEEVRRQVEADSLQWNALAGALDVLSREITSE